MPEANCVQVFYTCLLVAYGLGVFKGFGAFVLFWCSLKCVGKYVLHRLVPGTNQIGSIIRPNF